MDEAISLLIKKCANGNLVVTCVGAGYVGSLTAITMAVLNPSVSF